MKWPVTGSWQQPTESNHWSWSSCNYVRSCHRTQHQPLGHLAFEANWKGEKARNGGVSWVDHKSKISSLWGVIFSSSMQQWWTMCRSHVLIMWRVIRSGLYMTTGDDQLSGWIKKKLQSTSQSQTCTKKGSWSLSGGLLPVWSTTAFWITKKPLNLRNTLSKSMRCTKNCTVCSRHWSAVCAQFSSTTVSNCTWHNPTLQKLNELGREVLPYLPYSPDLLSTDYHFFKHLNNFLQGKMFPQPGGGRKYYPRVYQISKRGFLHYRNKQTYFSSAKMCWL